MSGTVRDQLAGGVPTFSFEFFPPKTDEASEELFRNIAQLQALRPSFVSVTYGAGGATRNRTLEVTKTIKEDLGLAKTLGKQ